MDEVIHDTTLFIGGVGPEVTHNDLTSSFGPDISILSSSVIRIPGSNKCIGQAYVTIRSQDLNKALDITEIGRNAVAVFPVDVDVSVVNSVTARQADGRAAAVCQVPVAAPAYGPGPSPDPDPDPDPDPGPGPLMAAPGPSGGGLAAATAGDYSAGKCSVSATAMHDTPAAAAAASSLWPMALGSAGPFDGSGLPKSPHPNLQEINGSDAVRAVTAVSLCDPMEEARQAAAAPQPITGLGDYPRCEELMARVHATPGGRVKTVLAVLHEYAAQSDAKLIQEDVSPAQSTTGPFRFKARLEDYRRHPDGVVEAIGPDRCSKKEAKQASAAALFELLLSSGITTVDEVM